MTKNKSIVLLCVLSVILLVATALFCIPAEVQLGYSVYSSPLNTILLGDDLNQGVIAIFDITRPSDMEDEEFAADVEQIVKTVRARFTAGGCSEAVVSYSQEHLTVRIPAASNPQSVLSTLTSNGTFATTVPSDSDSSTNIVVLDNSYIDDCVSGYSSSEAIYFFGIVLNEEGAEIMADLTEDAASTNVTFTFYIGGEEYNSMTASEPFTSNTIYFTADDADSVETLMYILDNGYFESTLTSNTTKYISASYGEHTPLIVGIIVIFVLVALIVALCLAYKLQGVAASMALLFNSLLLLWIFTISTVAEFTTAGLFAVIIVSATFAMTCKALFDKSRESLLTVVEATADKKVSIANSRSWEYNLVPTIKFHVIGMVAGIAMWIFGLGALKSFGVILTYGLAISLLSAIFVVRFLCYVMRKIQPDIKSLGLETKEVQDNE